jgi:hypothetical protein
MIPNSPTYLEFKEILRTVCKFQLPEGISAIVFRLPPKKEVIGVAFPVDYYGKFFYQSDFGKKAVGPFDTREEAQRAWWKTGNFNEMRSRIASIIIEEMTRQELRTEVVFDREGVRVHLDVV